MANNDSIGFVEAYGMVAAIEAADAMVKAARVKVKTVLNADVGMLSVICEGDLAACKAAGCEGVKGHRSVGGFRASIYNAMTKEGVDALVAVMQELARKKS